MMNLADPELELVDPTPNVHSMFLHFDKTFFWTKLESRCVVRWSKRMYSCAGICSYEGRGGVCDIALSEPLLKLRPRKDLVETLLHEMIHAFLFITRRDQDRDGHGPNFQAHMHRINRAAGLNISIYHDFHEEVQLYQTHWWRCNGPCQTKKPHFGIVRRSMNRAPGPSDYWWNSHQRCCGGTFVKIKEPEKPEKKNKKSNVAKPNADITKYINNNNNKEVNNKNVVQNDKPKKPVLKDSSNIPVKPNVGGVKSNSSSTVVVTKKNVIFNPQVPKPKPVVFSGVGQTISGERKRTTSGSVLETVRNVWANKQLTTNNNNLILKNSNSSDNLLNTSKHKADTPIKSPPPKIKKIDEYFKTSATSMLKNLYGQDFNITQSKNDQKLIAVPQKIDLVDCPVCNTKINSSDINRHLDECLNKSVIEKLTKDSIPVIQSEDIEGKRSKVKEEHNILNDIKSELKTKNSTTGLFNTKTDYNINRIRSSTSFDQSNLGKIEDRKAKDKVRKSDSFIMPIKSEIVETTTLENATDVYIKIEPGCSKPDLSLEKECPCCGDKLNKSVDEHLEECLSFFDNDSTIPEEGASTSFANETIVIDDDEDDKFDETQTMNATGTKLPCPCCLKMVEEIDMNSHLDVCLG